MTIEQQRFRGGIEWSNEEINYLKSNCEKLSVDAMIQHLGRSKQSIISKARRMGFTCLSGWNDDDVAYVKENYGRTDLHSMSQHLGRSRQAIIAKARTLGLSYWNDDEIAYIKENYGKLGIGDMSQHLGRSRGSIYQQANKMGFNVHQKNTQPKKESIMTAEINTTRGKTIKHLEDRIE